MNIEHELERLLDRYKLENDIKSVFYNNRGLFDNSNMWLLLAMFIGLNGFGSSFPPASITNFYPEQPKTEVKSK